MRTIQLLVVCLALLGADLAAAPIAFDNGAGSGARFSVTQNYLIADDFTFGVDTILTHVSAWVSADSGSMSWLILDGDDESPNRLISSGPIVQSGFDPAYFSVGAIPLLGGHRYWLGVYAGKVGGGAAGPCDQYENVTHWETTAQNGSSIASVLSYQNRGWDCADGPAPPWDFEGYWSSGHGSDVPDDVYDLAFKLHGRPAGQSVPEPSAVLLAMSGVCACLWHRRHARHKGDDGQG